MGKLYVASPEGRSWPIDLDSAESSMRDRWPDGHFSRPISTITGTPYLTFDVNVAGVPRYGTYAGGECLTLSAGSPQVWASTIVWFLGLLPEGEPALALAEDNRELAPIPAGASIDDIVELYERLETG